MARQDREYVRQVMRQFNAQKAPAKYVIKLPCTCKISVELSRPVDQPVQCPVCKKGWHYVHSQKGLFTK